MGSKKALSQNVIMGVAVDMSRQHHSRGVSKGRDIGRRRLQRRGGGREGDGNKKINAIDVAETDDVPLVGTSRPWWGRNYAFF